MFVEEASNISANDKVISTVIPLPPLIQVGVVLVTSESVLNGLFAYWNGGYFNIHIWACFDYFIC